MPWLSILLDFRVLLLRLLHAKNYIILGNTGYNKVNCIASLFFCSISNVYILEYDHGSAQRLAIDSGDKCQAAFPSRLQTEPICNSRGDNIVGGD